MVPKKQHVNRASYCIYSSIIERDKHGVYPRARNGEIRGFTGVDDPYEDPPHCPPPS